MEFSIDKISIKDLTELYNDGKLNLQPAYQRNPVWDKRTKQLLIDTIIKNYPLPTIFLHKKDDGNFDMVDGQQRTRTILSFIKNTLEYKPGVNFSSIDTDKFLNYEIPLVTITNIDSYGKIEDYYARVNSSGKRLNRPELLKAKFFDTNFMRLVEDLTELPIYENLNIFSESSQNRMNDLDFTAELIGLIKLGRTDKKAKIDDIFEEDLSDEECNTLRNIFINILAIICKFNEIEPIRNTRYRQRNDFYSLFDFLLNNNDKPLEFLCNVYSVLILIDESITPSNEECEPLQEYALNCVSQSNSKNAREKRYDILASLFLNTFPEISPQLQKLLEFYGLESDDIENVCEFTAIDLDLLEDATN